MKNSNMPRNMYVVKGLGLQNDEIISQMGASEVSLRYLRELCYFNSLKLYNF